MLLGVKLRQYLPQLLCVDLARIHSSGQTLTIAKRRTRSNAFGRDQRHTITAYANPVAICKRYPLENVACEVHVLAPAFGAYCAVRARRRHRTSVGPTTKRAAGHNESPGAEDTALEAKSTYGGVTLTHFPADHNALPIPPLGTSEELPLAPPVGGAPSFRGQISGKPGDMALIEKLRLGRIRRRRQLGQRQT